MFATNKIISYLIYIKILEKDQVYSEKFLFWNSLKISPVGKIDSTLKAFI